MKKGLMVLVLALCVCNVYAQAIKEKLWMRNRSR